MAPSAPAQSRPSKRAEGSPSDYIAKLAKAAMTSKPTVQVIGSLNIDFVTLTPRVPGPGEALAAKSMTLHAGGKGANQAVACGKAAFVSHVEQDVLVDMIGAVGAGDLYYASLVKPTLTKAGVSTRYIEEIDGVQTGTATIIVDESSNGENRILFVSGANGKVEDANKIIAIATADTDPKVVVMQGEIPRSTTLRLLSAFNSEVHRTCVIFNPAPIFEGGLPLDVLKNLAVLVVNETECLLLFRSVAELKSVELPEEQDLAGISIVVVTLGARGVFYSATNPDVNNLMPPTKVAKVVDTTATGDTFVGYFAAVLARHLAKHGVLEEFDVKSAVSRANQAAATCVQRRGAMESIPFGYE